MSVLNPTLRLPVERVCLKEAYCAGVARGLAVADAAATNGAKEGGDGVSDGHVAPQSNSRSGAPSLNPGQVFSSIVCASHMQCASSLRWTSSSPK